jgi:hypothetical protein
MAKTELFVRKQPGGMFAVINEQMAVGDIFFVDSNTGTDGASNGKDPDTPVATIDYAIGLCTANKNDVILVFPQHAETVTTAITVDIAGVSIIGLGHGRNRPTITGNGTIDAMTVTANDVTIKNLIFAVPGTDAQTADINIAAARCTVENTVHHGSTTAKNKVDIITITAAGHDALLDGVRIHNDTVEVVGGIVFEGACKRAEVRNCFVFDSVGFTNGAISDEATALGLYIHHNVFSNAKAGTVVAEFGNNSTGVMSFNHINGRHTTLASNVTAGTGMAFFENRVVEEAAVNGAIIPAADTD